MCLKIELDWEFVFVVGCFVDGETRSSLQLSYNILCPFSELNVMYLPLRLKYLRCNYINSATEALNVLSLLSGSLLYDIGCLYLLHAANRFYVFSKITSC